MPIRLPSGAAAPKYRFANDWLTITTGWLPSRSPAAESRAPPRGEAPGAEDGGATAARGGGRVGRVGAVFLLFVPLPPAPHAPAARAVPRHRAPEPRRPAARQRREPLRH